MYKASYFGAVACWEHSWKTLCRTWWSHNDRALYNTAFKKITLGTEKSIKYQIVRYLKLWFLLSGFWFFKQSSQSLHHVHSVIGRRVSGKESERFLVPQFAGECKFRPARRISRRRYDRLHRRRAAARAGCLLVFASCFWALTRSEISNAINQVYWLLLSCFL